MKRMGKRIVAATLLLCLLFALVPTSANAAASEKIYNFLSVYQANANLSDLQELIAANYGRNGWCVQDYNIADAKYFKTDGLRLYANETEWIAFKIKTPGTGVYTLKLDYTSSILSGTVAAYILPANTADIGAAISYENRVGMATLTNLENTSNLAGSVTFGTWNFGSDAEYILVLEAYRHSVYSDKSCQMRLKTLTMTPGDHTQGTQQQSSPAVVKVDPGPIKILAAAPYYGTTAKVNGNDYLFLPLKGNTVLAFDLDHNLLMDEIKVPHSITRGITVVDGVLWCVGEGRHLFRYDPVTRIGEKMLDLGDVLDGAQDACYMHYADGCLYFGIFPNGAIGRYEIATGNFRSYGPFHDECNTVSAITTQGGYIYAGITGDKDGENGFTSQIVKIHAATGEVEGRLDLSSGSDAQVKLNADHRQFNGVAVAGNLLLMGSNTSQKFIIAVDTRTMDFVDLNTQLGINAGVEFDFTEEVEIDGKTYIYFNITGKGIYALDVTGVTDTTVVTDNVKIRLAHADLTGWVNPKPLRCGKHSIVELDDPQFPGKSIVTYYVSDGMPRLYNLQTGETKICLDMVDVNYGTAIQARPLVNDGNGNLYIGAFNTPKCAVYNTATGELTNFESNSAQTDAFTFLDGVTYTGNYNNASITRINPDGENKQLLEMKTLYNQARVHAMTAGGGKVFAGTTPYTGHGGCFAWVDVANGDRTVVKENFIENQSINSLTYHGGVVFGTTYTSGGSGSGSLEGLSAVLFAYDVNADKKYAFDLRQEPYRTALGIDESVAINYIAGVAADPDGSGKIWGMISQTLFSFTFDKQTGVLNVKKELSFGANEYVTGGGRGSFPRPFCFDDSGNLYVSFDDDGGVRRINTANVSDNQRLPLPVLNYYALGADGNLYYTWGTELMMYPLHIGENDTQVVATVDAKILAIGNAVTLDTETQIAAARAAYEAMSLTEKSMVQNLYMLEEQEAQLLECKIDAIPETVAREDMQLLDSLWETYSDMTDRQKRLIKNYAALVEAINEMNANLGVAAFRAGDRTYYAFDDAAAAALAGDKMVTLVEDVAVGELLVTDGITIDLNGKILTAEAFRANLPGLTEGYVVDSSAGNAGAIVINRGEDLFAVNNPDMPVYDAATSSYRFFDYRLQLHTQTEKVAAGAEKFWFKFHFYTDDTCAEMDQDAYALIAADGSNMEISTEVRWREKPLPTVSFGWKDENGALKTELFCEKWADTATLSRWLYVVVRGLDQVGLGVLKVTPTITVNGVVAQEGAISYEVERFNTGTGWDDFGPGQKN